MDLKTKYRIPLLLSAFIIFTIGLWAGLMRMGWSLTFYRPTVLLSHGYLMIPGFLGTLIGLERAVALQKKWSYIGPLASAIGSFLLINNMDSQVGYFLLLFGSVIMAIIFIIILRTHFVNHTITMALGGFSLLIGNILWGLGFPVYQLVIWWMGFLILTIAGERLELGRLMRQSKAVKTSFTIIIVIFLTGSVVSIFNLLIGQKIISIAMILLALWLFRNDIARKTIRQDGLPKFIAYSLLIGYLWLIVAGIIGLSSQTLYAGPVYDAYLHSVLLGFVMSMIFAHAPIILPAIIRSTTIIFKPILYLPLILLHLSLLLRVLGDFYLENILIRQWGGMINAITILLYFGITIINRAPTFKKDKIL